MTMEQQLRQLEARVDELLRISAHLRQENRLLRERETRLLDDRAQLVKKNDLAKAKPELVEELTVKLESIRSSGRSR